MRRSTNARVNYCQQQQQSQEDSQNDDYSDDEIYKHKKPAPIPRFVKNKIDAVDTDVIILNISRTQYEVVEEVAIELGWEIQRSKKSQKWDIMWIDSHIEAHDLFKLNEHQKISHFPAIYVLTRKNFLGKSLMKMRNFFPQEYNFFPSTWSIPIEFTQLLRFDEKLDKSEGNQFYIYKPEAMAQGKGIKLYDNVSQLEGKTGIVQQYVNNPFLIENLKFDLRIYVLIMGYDPLRIFIYDEGLGRFATQKYQRIKKKNMKDVHMHLTNYAINKNNKNFIFNNSDKEMDKGHKRSLSAIYNFLNSRGIDTEKLKRKIDEIVIKTLIVGQPMIAHTYGLAQSDSHANDLCFHILGFDVLINDSLQPILLEVNHTPSFKTDTPLDKFIKKNLIKDTLKLLNVNVKNKKQKIEMKREQIELRSQRKLVKLTNEQKQQIRKKKWKERDEYQMANLGNFRKIFPTEQSFKYKEMIQISKAIFNETNGMKNKSTSPTKQPYTNRPGSYDKEKLQKYVKTSPLLSSLKQKVLEKINQSKSNKKASLNQNQVIEVREKLGKSLNSCRSKFPSITLKKFDNQRNMSSYAQTSVKVSQFAKEGVQRLQRTTSYRKNTKLQGFEPLENQLYEKGKYVAPRTLQMDPNQIQQKSLQLIQTSAANSNSQNLLTKLAMTNKVRNFEDIAEQALMQIQSISPKKTKYENLLHSLSSSCGGGNYYKQQFVKLKSIKKG